MGKLAEIKDMEQADSNQSKEFEKFAESQKEHNRVMEKLMKMTAGCAVGALAVVVVAVLAIVPRTASVLGSAGQISSQLEQMLPQAKQTLEDAQQITEQVKNSNPQQLLGNLNELSQQGQVALEESVQEVKKAVDVLEKIDIEALNKAIDNLGKEVSPLAKLFGGNKRWIIQVKTFMCRPSIFLKAGTS